MGKIVLKWVSWLGFFFKSKGFLGDSQKAFEGAYILSDNVMKSK